MKRWGPRTEPWGTPEVTGEGLDVRGVELDKTSLSGGAVSNATGGCSVVEDGVRINVREGHSSFL